jgi:flagellar biosynthetic protein FlhB
MSGQEDGEKIHEPTQHKLDEARKKGEVARSQDLSTAAGYGGILLTAIAFGAPSMQKLGTSLMVLLDQPEQLAPLIFEGQMSAPIGGMLIAAVLAMGAWFLVPAAAVLLTIIAQRSFIVAPDKLKFKLSRISMISNVKNKFGRGGLFEFAKSFAKLVIYSTCLGFFLSSRADEMFGTVYTNPQMASMLLAQLCIEFMFVVLLIAGSIGVIDYLWQYHEHLRKNRMSHKEMQDEHKSTEGDPHMKQERRQRAYSIAMNQMLADVPEADVVIVNPTHYAVALKWSRRRGEAPECVAKGVDEIAARIREIAIESNVPVRSDPPTARALFATTQIGQQISSEHFRAVAAAIRFADTIRAKMRGNRR